MARSKSFFESKIFKNVMGKIYGLGAAVVIIGAWAKILHIEGANLYISVGLLTEAFIFTVSAFEPIHEEPDWTLVYPELAGLDPKSGKKAEPGALTKTLDQMLADAKIEQTTINRLGESMKGLTDNVNKIGTIGDAAMATKNYADKAQEAAGAMTKLNASYTSAISAIEKIGAVGDTSKKYQDTLASVTQNMSSLNSIYEAELKETNNQVKKLNDAYGQFTKTIANLGGAEESTRMMKDEFNKLGKNLSTLNNIYGNMLSAMSAPRS